MYCQLYAEIHSTYDFSLLLLQYQSAVTKDDEQVHNVHLAFVLHIFALMPLANLHHSLICAQSLFSV
jgi:hypothetical protein